MAFLSEAEVEETVLTQLESLGWVRASEELIVPDGKEPERAGHDEVSLRRRFEAAIARLNPETPETARQEAARWVMQTDLPSLLEENRCIHQLMTEGVGVE